MDEGEQAEGQEAEGQHDQQQQVMKTLCNEIRKCDFVK